MLLTDNDKPWMPRLNVPESICLLTQRETPPKNLETFLLAVEPMFARLVEEEDDVELLWVQDRVGHNLPSVYRADATDWRRRESRLLFLELAPWEHGGMWDWRDRVAEALRRPRRFSKRLACETAEELNLAVWMESLGAF